MQNILLIKGQYAFMLPFSDDCRRKSVVINFRCEIWIIKTTTNGMDKIICAKKFVDMKWNEIQ